MYECVGSLAQHNFKWHGIRTHAHEKELSHIHTTVYSICNYVYMDFHKFLCLSACILNIYRHTRPMNVYHKICIHDCKWNGTKTVIIVLFSFNSWNIFFLSSFRIVTLEVDTQNSQLRGFCSTDKKKKEEKKTFIINK